ncbi:MAG: protein kinase [Candidatus Promineifilaceae bacterium]
MINKNLGPYELIGEIGKGGMATVYRAYQPSMDRFVAIKIIKQSVLDDEEVRERFQREARLIARLEHPHILPVYDFDGSNELPYIVMRYLEGGTLKDVLNQGSLPFDEITFILLQIGPALDYAHRQGVVHRDIKPSNVLIDLEGNALVMDFGIARVVGQVAERQGLTAKGVSIGTPDYMAPEQIMGLTDLDHRADVYSLGVMVFQMTTGQLPFAGDAPMSTMLMHLREPVPNASEINPELPSTLDDVLKRAMAKEPADRYDSAQVLTAAVVSVLGGLAATTPTKLKMAAQESAFIQRRRLSGEASTPVRAETRTTPSEENRSITAMYANAAEFTEIIDLIEGPEAAREAMVELKSVVAECVDRNGGLVFNQGEHDILALWGAIVAREDDAERAVQTALEIRKSINHRVTGFLSEEEPLPVRIGVNSGLALLSLAEDTGTFTASGATISLASRVADNADGLVLITHDTFRQVQGIFEIEPDTPIRMRQIGGRAFVDTYRVYEQKPRPFRLKPRGIEGVETRMIGRRSELEQIQKAFFIAVEESETQMVTVVGDPGVGKTRLLYEFASWAELRPEMYFIFRVRSTPAMTNRPLALWRELLSFRFEILDDDPPKVVHEKMEAGILDLIGEDGEMAHLMGHLAGFDFVEDLDFSKDPKDIADRARRAAVNFFHRLTQVDPVVLQLDDIHYADDASLDLLAEIAIAHENLPLLLISTARPQLYDQRPTWGSGRQNHQRINLSPLDKRDARDLASELLQRVDSLPRELRDLIAERSEGNPYYLEELVKMLLEDRVILKVDELKWAVEDSRIERLRVPPTLIGLLQARFDSLLYPEKLTLQRAAVAGRVFHDGALDALDEADEIHVDDLSHVLESLSEREFIFPRDTSAFSNNREYLFGQAMLRDLILETLLTRQVKVYNKAMADWLADQGGERASEYDALIAEHYEKAGELGLAAKYFEQAGRSAVNRGALSEAIQIEEHSLKLLDEEEHETQRLRLLLHLSGIHGWSGDYTRSYELLQPALKLARKSGDRQAEAVSLGQLGRMAGAWQGDYDRGRTYLEKALIIARELDEKDLLMFILRQLGNLAYPTGRHDEATQYLEKSLLLAAEIEDTAAMANALNSLGENERHRGDPIAALAYYRQAQDLEGIRENPNLDALTATNIGYALLEQERFQESKEQTTEALIKAEELGSNYLTAGCKQILGGASTGLGEDELARIYLMDSFGMFHEMGNLPDLLYSIADLARLELRAGNRSQAVELLGMARSQPEVDSVTRLRIEKTIAEFSGELPEEEVSEALIHGKSMELEEVILGYLEKE